MSTENNEEVVVTPENETEVEVAPEEVNPADDSGANPGEESAPEEKVEESGELNTENANDGQA